MLITLTRSDKWRFQERHGAKTVIMINAVVSFSIMLLFLFTNSTLLRRTIDVTAIWQFCDSCFPSTTTNTPRLHTSINDRVCRTASLYCRSSTPYAGPSKRAGVAPERPS